MRAGFLDCFQRGGLALALSLRGFVRNVEIVECQCVQIKLVFRR